MDFILYAASGAHSNPVETGPEQMAILLLSYTTSSRLWFGFRLIQPDVVNIHRSYTASRCRITCSAKANRDAIHVSQVDALI